MNKRSINLFFLGIDIVIIIFFTGYSIGILQSHIPSLSTNITNSLNLMFNKELDVIILSLYQLFLFYLCGLYQNKLNLSISSHLTKTLTAITIAHLSLFIYFFGIYNLFSTINAWNTFIKLVIVVFIAISISHTILILILRHLIIKGHWNFRTILIGSNSVLENNYGEIAKMTQLTGNKIIKTINLDKLDKEFNFTPHYHLSNFTEIGTFYEQYQPEEIIIAVPSTKEVLINNFITVAKMHNIPVKLIPDMESIMKGFATINKLIAPPCVFVSKRAMPTWQIFAKRVMDITFSITGIITILPFVPFIVFQIKRSSKGPIFYTQTRIGKNGKPFKIIKFRTMYTDAEKDGPSLSSETDNRVTPYGRFLRRWRIDETPQFVNVLLGQMSIVGPRPERSFFINKISRETPNFSLILQTRPGITSLGMVKYGYAENVKQMIQRLSYDTLYMENISIWLDIKILLYTLKTIISGEGK